MCQCRDERQNISGCFCFVFSKASFRDENFTSAKMFFGDLIRNALAFYSFGLLTMIHLK